MVYFHVTESFKNVFPARNQEEKIQQDLVLISRHLNKLHEV